MATRSYKYLDLAIGDATLPLFYSSVAPASGTSGTFAGVAIESALLITGEPGFYQNTGTLASPAWTPVNVAGANGIAQPTVANPTAPTSTSGFLMQGLNGAITPTKSGNVLVIISGNFISASGTAGVGIKTKISYGTGTAPTNGAALAGTQVGNTLEYVNSAAETASDVIVPFSQQCLIGGLTLGTTYWLDLAAEAVTTASEAGISNISLTAVEV